MKLEEVRICASATAQYEKYEAEFTVSDVDITDDLSTIKQLAISTAVSGLNDLLTSLGLETTKTPEVKTTVSKAPVKPSYYSKPKPTVPPVPTAPKYQGMMNSHEPKVGDLKEINGQTYKLCFNKNNGEWFYANQGETTNECPKYIKYE